MKAAIALAVALLASCGERPHSIAYFEGHPEEAARVIARCSRAVNQGPTCANALEGEARAKRNARMANYRRVFE